MHTTCPAVFRPFTHTRTGYQLYRNQFPRFYVSAYDVYDCSGIQECLGTFSNRSGHITASLTYHYIPTVSSATNITYFTTSHRVYNIEFVLKRTIENESNDSTNEIPNNSPGKFFTWMAQHPAEAQTSPTGSCTSSCEIQLNLVSTTVINSIH